MNPLHPLTPQFENALSAIEIDKAKRDRAANAHKEIRELLHAAEQLIAWGIDTVLIGSYARHTGIYPGKDVDVFAKLTRLDTSANPQQIFAVVEKIICDEYGDRAEPQRRSIKVDFGDGLSVDVVPAVSLGQRWALPNHDPQKWADENQRWIETDPEKLTKLTEAANTLVKIGERGVYVPTVKLVRQTRREHLGDAKPGGLYFEILTYWAFQAGANGATWAEVFANTLRKIADQLAGNDDLINPVLGEPYAPAPEPSERDAAARVFNQLADDAARALALDRCPAAAAWRKILGSNDRGNCFPLPAGCDAEGRAIGAISGVTAHGSGEAHGFG